ncbi:MAG: KilA-N domain-containing protein [Bacilli bacterium]|jgi:kilA domain protein
MKLEIYNDAIEEYLDNLEQTLKELHQNSCLNSEDVDETLKNAKEQIDNLLKTNEHYAKLQLDLEHLRFKDGQKYSLTEIAKRKDSFNPSYVIQSWLRDKNTLELLCLWEKEHNPDFNLEEARKLIDKTKESSFTLTSKIWITNTNAKGLVSKQGKGGGTYAHHEIAIDFIVWMFPEKRYELMKMIINRILQMR